MEYGMRNVECGMRHFAQVAPYDATCLGCEWHQSRRRQPVSTFALAQEVAQPVHIESQGEAQCLIQRRSLRRGQHI